jgi:hypothetical protein
MKHTPILTILLILGAALGLHAQTSSLLIKPGDRVGGISSTTPATLDYISSVSMNDLGGIAFTGWASDRINTTNLVTNTVWTYTTNFVPWTNFSRETNYVTSTNTSVTATTNVVTRTNNSISYQYTNVLVSEYVINFAGTVTNVIWRTNVWNVNGTTNAYVSKTAQILYGTYSQGTFTNVTCTPQGYRAVTNTYTTNVNQISYQTNYTVTNRPVVTSTPILTNRPVVSSSTNTVVSNRVTSSMLGYSGIWASDTNGSNNLLIRSGQPSGISDFKITSLYNPVINNNGAVACIGYSMATNSVTTTNGTVTNALTSVSSIYLALPGATNPVLVASVGSPAPGLSDNFTSFGTIVLPDVGGVIFTAWAGTNNGIWVQDSDFSVKPVALRGQSITVGSSNKVISNFSYPFPGNKFHSQDTGIITYQAYFTDGTSAVVRVNR